MKPFRIAVIGCGGISVQAHGPSLAKYAAERDGVVLAACCDVAAEKAETYRERFDFLRAYTDMEEIMERERPDAHYGLGLSTARAVVEAHGGQIRQSVLHTFGPGCGR